MHAIPAARLGFSVLAMDTCAFLLEELRARAGTLPIQVEQSDLLSFPQYLPGKPELVLCMGDTLTHLPDEASVTRLVEAVSAEISGGGRFVISLRDYTTPLNGEQRFIPVRSEENRILTCFLEYTDSHVGVHDILHQPEGTQWKLTVSSYRKIRLSLDWLAALLRENGFTVFREVATSGMIRLVACRA
jgi:hypothetical protein